MNYPDSVHFLYALGNEIKTAKLGLERIRAVLEALGRPQDRCRFVHVAGTNGKGSTCAMIESGLRAAGLRTGLFTSPHLSSPPSASASTDAPLSRASASPPPSTASTPRWKSCCAAAPSICTPLISKPSPPWRSWCSRAKPWTWWCSKWGWAGGWTPPTWCSRSCASSPPIDFDHEAYLGRSLEAIAGEKAGILKPGVPAVFARQRPEAARCSKRAPRPRDPRAADGGMDVERSGARRARQPFPAGVGQAVSLPIRMRTASTSAAPWPASTRWRMPSPPRWRWTRWACRPPRSSAGIAARAGPAAWSASREHPEIILDGAHNPAGARALAAYIDRFYSGRRVRLIYGAMRDKAVAEIGGILFPVAAAGDRHRAAAGAGACSGGHLCDASDHPTMQHRLRLEDALALVRDAPPEDVIFVTGSLFLVAEARRYAGGRSDELSPFPADFHAADRAFHHRDGHALHAGFAVRPQRQLAAPPGAGVGAQPAGVRLHPRASRRAGKARPRRQLRVRLQPRQLHGHSRDSGRAAATSSASSPRGGCTKFPSWAGT